MIEQEDVNHPSYYAGDVETIEVIRYYCLDIGNVLKYLSRAGKKEISSEAKDLKKAYFYIKDYIGELHRSSIPMRSEPLKVPSFLKFEAFTKDKKYAVIMKHLENQGLVCNMGDGDIEVCEHVLLLLEKEIQTLEG